MNNTEFTTIQYPLVRLFTSDVGKISHDKHYVRTLLEVDVTNALQKLKVKRVPGKKVSFQAWFIKILADTVADHPPINGIRKGRNEVVVFKQVNISTVVEKMVNGSPVPLPVVLKAVNEMNLLQINNEIQAAVEQSVENAGNYVLGSGENYLIVRLALLMPQHLRLFCMRNFILRNPLLVQKMMGTVMVTSIATAGYVSGWIIPTSMHSLSIGIGSLNKREVLREGKVKKHSILHLTLAFDHDIVDGMPAFIFVDDLVSRLEKGVGLD